MRHKAWNFGLDWLKGVIGIDERADVRKEENWYARKQLFIPAGKNVFQADYSGSSVPQIRIEKIPANLSRTHHG